VGSVPGDDLSRARLCHPADRLVSDLSPLLVSAFCSICFLVISLAANSVWLIWRGVDWRNDLYIITDDRVIDIEKVPFRYEHRREASLDKIQDVRYLQEGFIALRLDFGNVRLETAGGIEAFTFDSVPHPKQVQAEIFKRIAQFRKETGRQGRKTRQAEFLDLLGRYHQGLQGNGEPEP